jgi:hypothetical protein
MKGWMGRWIDEWKGGRKERRKGGWMVADVEDGWCVPNYPSSVLGKKEM